MSVKIVDAPDNKEWHNARRVIVANRNEINNILSAFFIDIEEKSDDENDDTYCDMNFTVGDAKELVGALRSIYEREWESPKKPLGPLFPEEQEGEVTQSEGKLTGGNVHFDDGTE